MKNYLRTITNKLKNSTRSYLPPRWYRTQIYGNYNKPDNITYQYITSNYPVNEHRYSISNERPSYSFPCSNKWNQWTSLQQALADKIFHILTHHAKILNDDLSVCYNFDINKIKLPRVHQGEDAFLKDIINNYVKGKPAFTKYRSVDRNNYVRAYQSCVNNRMIIPLLSHSFAESGNGYNYINKDITSQVYFAYTMSIASFPTSNDTDYADDTVCWLRIMIHDIRLYFSDISTYDNFTKTQLQIAFDVYKSGLSNWRSANSIEFVAQTSRTGEDINTFNVKVRYGAMSTFITPDYCYNFANPVQQQMSRWTDFITIGYTDIIHPVASVYIGTNYSHDVTLTHAGLEWSNRLNVFDVQLTPHTFTGLPTQSSVNFSLKDIKIL